MQKMLIYCPKITPRIHYVFDFIFNEFLGISFELTTNQQFFEAASMDKMSYAEKPIQQEFHLPSDQLLFETGWDETVVWEKLHAVGQCFYALSRYEEYFPQKLDAHQRISGKGKVFKTPIVDEWIISFQKELLAHFPDLKFKKRQFKITLTCDVDQAWKFKHKGVKRTYGAYLKDVLRRDFQNFQKRKSVLAGQEKDPYDTFDFYQNLKRKYDFQMIFFWLMADYGPFDKNNPTDQPAFQQKIKEVIQWSDFGIHPSYASNQHLENLAIEIQRLREIVGQPILNSRQHYIKLHLPTTYRRLIEAGITADHSMAYADETGFRAGTCTPFYWYDLEKEEQTNLKIHPFCAMDVSMRNYRQLSAEEAKLELQRLKKSIEAVDGEMILLVHNSNLTEEWSEWASVLESVFQ